MESDFSEEEFEGDDARIEDRETFEQIASQASDGDPGTETAAQSSPSGKGPAATSPQPHHPTFVFQNDKAGESL
jgi:hypothetical protein